MCRIKLFLSVLFVICISTLAVSAEEISIPQTTDNTTSENIETETITVNNRINKEDDRLWESLWWALDREYGPWYDENSIISSFTEKSS